MSKKHHYSHKTVLLPKPHSSRGHGHPYSSSYKTPSATEYEDADEEEEDARYHHHQVKKKRDAKDSGFRSVRDTSEEEDEEESETDKTEDEASNKLELEPSRYIFVPRFSYETHHPLNFIGDLSTSPVESVSLDLEEEKERLFDDSLEEVDYNIMTDEEEEYVNVKVRVEKRAYDTSAMKVTVSVIPPSEADEITSTVDEDDDDDIQEVDSEEEVSESATTSDASSTVTEDQVEEDYESESGEEECSDCDTDECVESSGESDGSDPGESDKGVKSLPVVVPVPASKAPVRPKSSKTKDSKDSDMLEMLDSAIKNSEEIQTKASKLPEAPMQLLKEGTQKMEAAASSVVNLPQSSDISLSPLLGESDATSSSVVAKALGSPLSSSIITTTMKETVNGVKKDVHEGVTGLLADGEKLGNNAKTLTEEALKTGLSKNVNKIPIGQVPTSTLVTSLSAGHAILSSDTSLQPSPSRAIILEKVQVHNAPNSATSRKSEPDANPTTEVLQSATTLVDKIVQDNISPKEIVGLDINNVEVPLPNPVIASESVQEKEAHAETSNNDVPLPAQPSKFQEKEEYLSVYASDSIDSSDSDGKFPSSRRRKHKTKAELEEERQAVDRAKDKLIEEWQNSQSGGSEDLDDRFPQIIADMVSELHMDPVTPMLPPVLKEAVQPSEDEEASKPEEAKPKQPSDDEEDKEIIIDYTKIFPYPCLCNCQNHCLHNPPSSQGSPAHTEVSSCSGISRESSVESGSQPSHSLHSAGSSVSSVSSRNHNASDANDSQSEENQSDATVIAATLKTGIPSLSNQLPDSEEINNPEQSSTPTKDNPAQEPEVALESQDSNEISVDSEEKAGTLASADQTEQVLAEGQLQMPEAEEMPNMPEEQTFVIEEEELTNYADTQDKPWLSPNYLQGFGEEDQRQESIEDESDSLQRESPSQKRKWKNSAEIACCLSQYLTSVKTETVENCVSELVPLLTQLLVMSRKSKADHSVRALIATLSATRVLCERLSHVKVLSGEKALKNVDLSWLLRILCKLSSDEDSKLRPEAGFTLAKLVKAAGPELISRPIYFLLVMDEGSGSKKGTMGAKTKAVALDALTYALLTFPKEDFYDLEEISTWVCLVIMHPHRRVRQAALECIAVLGSQMGSPDAAAGRFRQYIDREAAEHYNRSGSDSSTGGGGGNKKGAIRTFDGAGVFEVSATTAISCRIKKRSLPLPSAYGLIDYGVKVPTGQELVVILTKMQEDEEEIYELSSSSEESDHQNSAIESESESIRMSDLERSMGGGSDKGPSPKIEKDKEEMEEDVEPEIDVTKVITPDVAYILAGKGRVAPQDSSNPNTMTEEQDDNNNPESKKKAEEKAKRKKLLKKKKRRHVERTYSEYEDDDSDENAR